MPGVLSLIWMAALALVALAFAALAALIVARVLRERRERAEPNRRARMSKALLAYAAGASEAPALNASSRFNRQILVETALNALPILRGPATARMLTLLHELGLDAELRKQALHGSLRDRLLALEGLRLFPDEETIATLHRAEQSRDLRIWLTALRTRSEIGAGPDMDGLLHLVDRPGARRSPVMQDLIAARARKRLPEALRALQRPMPDLTRALLVRELGETRQLQALDPLRVALHNPDAAVRAAAAEALGALGFDAAGDALMRATRDTDWRVRLKASEAIGRLGLWRQAEALKPLLEDPVWWVRFRAEEALKRLGDFAPQPPAKVTGAGKRARGARS